MSCEGCFWWVEPMSQSCALAVEVTITTCTVCWKDSWRRVFKRGWDANEYGKHPRRMETQSPVLGPDRCSVEVRLFSPFCFTDFYPSDPKLWGCINNAVWVDEKATMYYLRLPERNRKFSPCCRHLPERQAADWDLAQSRNNVLGICLNPA